jgi:curli biogenesis system outer membrane secretion channel CsgG
MKLLATAVFAGMMTFSLSACSEEKTKKDPVQVAQADVKKDTAKSDEPVYKTVCLDVQGKDGKPVIDPKTNKPRQNCTKVRVREKFEGTKIEDAKKK